MSRFRCRLTPQLNQTLTIHVVSGSREVLADRLMENMMDTGDFALKNENGEDVASAYSTAGQVSSDVSAGTLQNNYARHSGQNVGESA